MQKHILGGGATDRKSCSLFVQQNFKEELRKHALTAEDRATFSSDLLMLMRLETQEEFEQKWIDLKAGMYRITSFECPGQ